MYKLLFWFTFVNLFCSCTADIYFHNPRGSNNRWDEDTRNRKNAKRLFDSQNNDRGGYNMGYKPIYLYSGSKLQIEWTNQHSCHDANNHCELIIQYMCSDNIRDGQTKDTIPLDQKQCANNDCNTDQKYGMHEDFSNYAACMMRERNKGLFTADQNMKGNRHTAIFTRQENNGNNNRYGYECPEERDYYPYWHPSPWKDIAVMTNNAHQCTYYQTESENVKSRWACHFSTDDLVTMYNNKVRSIPNHKEACETFSYDAGNGKVIEGVWKEFPSHGLPAPACRETEFTRDNHLGNGFGGNPNFYNWTIPNDLVGDKCVLRIRYNISTNDYDGWDTNASYSSDPPDPTKGDLYTKYGLGSMDAAKERGYVFEGNPNVQIFSDVDVDYQLAIDTSQFGRTFQDRTHTMSFKARPGHLKGATIHNVNVRGKRGNIVQVYPAVEYDFTPDILEIGQGEYIHFQWTGSDNNPKNNDGQGKAGSDRNNALLLIPMVYPEGNGMQYGPGETYGHYGNNYPNHLSNASFLGLEVVDLKKLAFSNGTDPNLNNSSPYFDLGPRQINSIGTYHYVCTRNNDFTNRDQKGRIMVTSMPFMETAVGYMGGSVTLPDGGALVTIGPGTFDDLHRVRLESWLKEDGERKMKAAGSELSAGEDYASDFVILYPQTVLTAGGATFTMQIKVDPDASNVEVYKSSSDSNYYTWTKLDTVVDEGVAMFRTDSGGVYVARSHSYTILIVALVLSALVIALIIIGAIVYFRRNPMKWIQLKSKTKNAKRSLNTMI